MLDLDAVNTLLKPLFPGLMGVRITDCAPDRVVAESSFAAVAISSIGSAVLSSSRSSTA